MAMFEASPILPTEDNTLSLDNCKVPLHHQQPSPSSFDQSPRSSIVLGVFEQEVVEKAASYAPVVPEAAMRLSSSRRHVAFSEQADDVIPSLSPLDILNANEKHRLWYQGRDLDDFRTEARDLCRQMRVGCSDNDGSSESESPQQQPQQKQPNTVRPSSPPMAVLPLPPAPVSLARCGQTRGLEQRSCLERQRRRYLANKCIVRAQTKLTPDRLAAMAQRCTHWAAELAAEEAARDFGRAYAHATSDDDGSDEYNASDDDEASSLTSSNSSNKRPALDGEFARRVKSRVF